MRSPSTAASRPTSSRLAARCPSGPSTKATCARASICRASSSYALYWTISRLSSSAMEATAKTCFSPMQRMLLSKPPPVDYIARGLGQIGRFIDHRGRIARTSDNGLLGATQCGLGHARPAGYQQQADIRVVEQFVGRLNRRRLNRGHQVGRPAGCDDGLIDQAHREHGDLSARRMYVEDDRVARGDNANGVVDHRRHGMCRLG